MDDDKHSGYTVSGNAPPPPAIVVGSVENRSLEKAASPQYLTAEDQLLLEDSRKEDGQMIMLSKASAVHLKLMAIPIPSRSIFTPEPTGVTYTCIGKSFSGKTTFIINELNKLTAIELDAYNAIFFFTTSPNATPLKNLHPRIRAKFILVPRLVKTVLMALTKINNETDLSFKFLVIFDDIIQLRGPLLDSCILTLRNSNISTMISCQYQKMMTPAQRSSVHNMYIFNVKVPDWEFLLKGFLGSDVREILPPLRHLRFESRIAMILNKVMGKYILYYNQREDDIQIWNKR